MVLRPVFGSRPWAIPVRFGSRPSPGGSQFTRNLSLSSPSQGYIPAIGCRERVRGFWGKGVCHVSFAVGKCVPWTLNLNPVLMEAWPTHGERSTFVCFISARGATNWHGCEFSGLVLVCNFSNLDFWLLGRWCPTSRRRAARWVEVLVSRQLFG